MQKAVFFDRDGVINIDYSYVYKIKDFEFYDDFFISIKSFKENGYKLVVVTNQSGIDRGYYSIIDFLHISKYMQEEIYKQVGFTLDRIYFCPLLNDTTRRKPSPGMILQAKKDLNINLEESYLVGDKKSDIMAGANAGIKNLYLINRNNIENKCCILDQNIKINYISTLNKFNPL